MRREEGCAPLTPAKFKVFSGGESGAERKLLRLVQGKSLRCKTRVAHEGVKCDVYQYRLDFGQV